MQVDDPSSDLEALGRKAVQRLAATDDPPRRAQELERMARLMERMRLARRHALALTLADAAGRANADLCMEEALAAFGLGDDARVRAIAEIDRDVQALFEPMVKGLNGPAPRGRAPQATATAKAMRELGKVVRSTSEGKVAPARLALKAAGPVSGDLWGPELSLAVELCAGPLNRLEIAFEGLVQSERVRAHEGVLAAVVGTTHRRQPALLSAPSARRHVPPALLHRVGLAALRAAPPNLGAPAEVARVLERFGIEAFAADQQAAALLYAGFSALAADADEALKRFDRADAKGADLGETLRGRALAEGRRSSGSPSALKRASDAWMRLAKLLLAEAEGLALAAQAALEAGQQALHAGASETALANASFARKVAEKAGVMRDPLQASIELLEAQALSGFDSAEAERRLDAVLARDPKNILAWEGKFALAPTDAVADVSRRAFEATGDRRFEPRPTRSRSSPAPARTPAGELACRLAETVEDRAGPELGAWLTPEICAARDALAPGPRAGVDGTAIALLHSVGQEKHADVLLEDALARPDLPPALRLPLLALGMATTQNTIPRALIAREVAGLSFPELRTLLQVAVDAGDEEAASNIVLLTAPRLATAELRELKRCLRLQGKGLCDLLDALERELGGAFPLHDFVHDDDLEALLYETDEALEGGPELFESMMDLFGFGREPEGPGEMLEMFRDAMRKVPGEKPAKKRGSR